MTLRERIADWISGGAITASHIRVRVLECRCDRMKSDADRLHTAVIKIISRGNTAKPNGTVKAMVRIAREGLGE